MKNLYKILFVILVFGQSAFAQTITKEASNNNPFLGEEFYYTITMSNLTSFSDLNYVEDNLGLELTYLGVEYNSALAYVKTMFCGGITETYNNNILRVDFSTCNASISGISNFSFKIKVKLNENACGSIDFINKATMDISDKMIINSNDSKVLINEDDPYALEKVFRDYESNTKEFTYDIRLNSAYGDFGMLDFTSPVRFYDDFEIPSCFDLGLTPTDNIKVVYIADENTMSQQPASNAIVNLSGNNLGLSWDLPLNASLNSNILYQVIITLNDCSCSNQLFEIKNDARFEAFDKCGNPIKKAETYTIPNVACINNEPDIPGETEYCFSKQVQLDDNDLNLAMKGCTGKYIITVQNCGTRLVFKDINITDILPPGLDYGIPVVTTNNGIATILTGNNLTVQSTVSFFEDDRITVEIPFEVSTNTPNLRINNCATATIDGYNIVTNTPVNFTDEECASFYTVPNKVAVNTTKSICKDPNRTCGDFSINTNVPGDSVEYSLHFYNYGTAEGVNIILEDLLPPFITIDDVNNDVKVFKKESRGNETRNSCAVSGFKPIDSSVKKKYISGINKLIVDFKNHKLDEFTCKGVTHYVVKVKAKIDVKAPNGTYPNKFFVTYKDTSVPSLNIAQSNTVNSIVNVDNLIITAKNVNENTPDIDCENKTKTYTYTILLANMGQIPVWADISDVLSNPSPANLLSYGNFKMCNSVGAGPLCIPTAPNGIPTTRTTNSFNITGLKLKPCEVTVITYEAVFDINPLSKNQVVKVCNNALIKTYVKDKSAIQPIITSNQNLIQYYLDAQTDEEKLDVISLIKAAKEKDYNDKSTNRSQTNANRGSSIFNYDVDSMQACLNLTECLPASTGSCLTDSNSSFNFQITGMNRNGEISTTLDNLPNKKITQIEYLLTDIRQIETCEDEIRTVIINGRKYEYNRSCFGCTDNVMGLFTTTNTSPIGMLNFTAQPSISGTFREGNKVSFKGSPTVVTQDNRTFTFPVGTNCNGTFEFTITAIVHFEDCSVCYITDAFDYNASWRFVIPPRPTRVPVLNGPRL